MDDTKSDEATAHRASKEALVPPPVVPSGLVALCIVAAHHQVSAEPSQLIRALGLSAAVPVGNTEILLAAKEIGLSARVYSTNWSRLGKLGLPAIAELKDGHHVAIMRRLDGERLLIADPREGRSRPVSREDFETDWSGWLILVKTRLALDNPNRPFDILWFLPAIWKYQRILGEVLAAAFVIQLFGLGMPLFTQVMIDKVLMHKSLATLHVLAIGMLFAILFEGLLTVLRTHLMAHTATYLDEGLKVR
jgi:ATP-binding cassette, subfamily B, bacterial HlyB/CyaB